MKKRRGSEKKEVQYPSKVATAYSLVGGPSKKIKERRNVQVGGGLKGKTEGKNGGGKGTIAKRARKIISLDNRQRTGGGEIKRKGRTKAQRRDLLEASCLRR